MLTGICFICMAWMIAMPKSLSIFMTVVGALRILSGICSTSVKTYAEYQKQKLR